MAPTILDNAERSKASLEALKFGPSSLALEINKGVVEGKYNGLDSTCTSTP